MTEEKPVAALVLSSIGGIVVLLVGLALAVLAQAENQISLRDGLAATASLAPGLYGVGIGLVIIAIAVVGYSLPGRTKIIGVTLIVLGVLALGSSLGGFFIGTALCIVGGILFYRFQTRITSAAPVHP